MGWELQTDSGGFDGPSSWLAAFSTDSAALLQLQCASAGVGGRIDLRVAPSRVLTFSGTDYFVSVEARFLPDSTVVDTWWTSRAAEGHFNMIEAHPGSNQFTGESVFARIRRADTLEAALPIYGEDRLVVRFPVENHDVLEDFLSKCTLPPEK